MPARKSRIAEMIQGSVVDIVSMPGLERRTVEDDPEPWPVRNADDIVDLPERTAFDDIADLPAEQRLARFA